MADPQLFEIGKTSPFYAMQAIAAQDAARRAAGAQLYQMYGGPQNPPMAQPTPQPGGGGLPPPPPGTPQGGPMPPQPGANPAPPPQQGGMPPPPPQMGGAPPPGGAPGPGAGAPPMQPMQRPLASPKPFQAMPTAPPAGPPQAGQIGAPPAAPPQQPDAGLLQPGKQFNLQALVQQLKGSGVPPDKVMDMLDQLTPVMNQQNQQELKLMQAQLAASKATESFYERRLLLELKARDVATKERAELRKTAEGVGGPFDKVSAGSAAATGQPLNQIVPGYGKAAAKNREQARAEAIAQIMAQTGMSNQEAGAELARRSIDFVAGKRSVTQLNTMLGATRQAIDQLEFNVKKVSETMKKLPSSDLSPLINSIIRGEEKWTGNPAYSELYYFMNAAAMESARILQGGQASVAQLHQGAADEAKKWADAHMTTPKAWNEGVAPAMIAEGRERLKTYERAIGAQRGGPAPMVGGGARDAAPQDALDYLKAHPETSQQFSAKYGYLPAGAR